MLLRRFLSLSLCFSLIMTATVSLSAFSRQSNSLQLKQADQYYRNRQYQKAYDKYLQIYTSKEANLVEREFAHYKMGECLEMSGETKLAIKEFVKLVKENPVTYKSAAKLKLIRLYTLSDNKHKAIELLQEEIKDNPRLISNYKELASLYTDTEQYKKALETYQAMLKKFPTIKTSVENNLIVIYQQLGLMEQKIAELKKQIAAKPNNDQLRVTLSKYYHFNKDYSNAIEEYQKIKNKSTTYYLKLGRLYYENQEPQQAIATWREIIHKNPRNISYYNRVTQVMKEAGFLEEVVKIYLQARSEQRNPNLYVMELARTYEVLGNLDGAMHEYFSYINRDPKKRYLVTEAIDTAIADGDSFEKIIAAIDKTIKENPENIEPHLILGDIYLKRKMAKKSVEHYLSAIRLSKIKEPGIYTLARKLANNSYYQEALVLYQELTELTSANVIYPQWLEVADVYRKVGESKKSQNILDKIINRQTRDNLTAKALLMRGQLSFENGQYNKALGDFRQLLNIYPNSKEQEVAQLFIVRSHYHSKEYEKAKKAITPLLTAMSIGENYFELLYLSARIELFLDDKEEARKTLQTLAEKYPQGRPTNDALSLVSFLQHTPNKHLTRVISALEKEEMFDYRGAISSYTELLQEDPQVKNAVAVWLKIGNLYRKQGLPEQAIKAFENALNGVPDSFYAAQAQMEIAAVYHQDLRDDKLAIKAYENILVKYQDSILVNEAREIIENLKLNVSP